MTYSDAVTAKLSGSVSKSWFKSSFSTTSAQCVEVRFGTEAVMIRDSKYLRDPANNPARQPVIAIPTAAWREFLDSVADASISKPSHPIIEYSQSGAVSIRAVDGTVLTFTGAEWAAFVSGVGAREFELS